MIIYNLLIQPIEYLVEVVYTVMFNFFRSEGYAIIAMSRFVSNNGITVIFARGRNTGKRTS